MNNTEYFQEQLKIESLRELCFGTQTNEMILVPSFESIQVQAFFQSVNHSNEIETVKEIVESPNNVNNVIPKHSEHILKMRKVKELKEMVRDIKRKLNFQFHWTWRQIKEDLIEIIMDPFNPKFLEKNPNSIKTQKSRKRKIKDSMVNFLKMKKY